MVADAAAYVFGTEAVHDPFAQFIDDFSRAAGIVFIPRLVEVTFLQSCRRLERVGGDQRGVSPAADRGAVQFHGVIRTVQVVAEQETVEMGESQQFGAAGRTDQGIEEHGAPTFGFDPLCRGLARQYRQGEVSHVAVATRR